MSLDHGQMIKTYFEAIFENFPQNGHLVDYKSDHPIWALKVLIILAAWLIATGFGLYSSLFAFIPRFCPVFL